MAIFLQVCIMYTTSLCMCVCVFECKICFFFVLFSPATLFSSLVFLKEITPTSYVFKLASGVVFSACV